MSRFWCAYLNAEVELTEERETHIARRHPDLLPRYRNRIAETLADPDLIRRSPRSATARLFLRWYTEPKGGRFVVVVVVSKPARARHWIVTAYIARRPVKGAIEWERN